MSDRAWSCGPASWRTACATVRRGIVFVLSDAPALAGKKRYARHHDTSWTVEQVDRPSFLVETRTWGSAPYPAGASSTPRTPPAPPGYRHCRGMSCEEDRAVCGLSGHTPRFTINHSRFVLHSRVFNLRDHPVWQHEVWSALRFPHPCSSVAKIHFPGSRENLCGDERDCRFTRSPASGATTIRYRTGRSVPPASTISATAGTRLWS